MDNLVLVGFSCSGKTTIGRTLARRLSMRFMDTDATIERTSGRTIPAIFTTDGELAFRQLEREAVQYVAGARLQIISTGGGTFVDPVNRDVLKDGNFVVHLQVEPTTVLDRLRASRSARPRPLLDVPDPLKRITELMAARKEAYELAHVTLMVDNRSRYDLVAEITRRWYAWRRAQRRATEQQVAL
jgi:shikimate kinase